MQAIENRDLSSINEQVNSAATRISQYIDDNRLDTLKFNDAGNVTDYSVTVTYPEVRVSSKQRAFMQLFEQVRRFAPANPPTTLPLRKSFWRRRPI